MPKKLPPIPAPNQLKCRKSLSISGLLARVRKEFEAIKEHRIKTISYKLTDVLMSALAMFGLKYPSLLQFDQSGSNPTLRTNLENLYGVSRVPSDTQMREILDPVAPDALRPAFRQIHRELQRQKALESYRYLGGYLMSVDGTGQFSSTAIKCEECCSRTLRNGTEQYYHQLLAAVIVHPEQKVVLPLFPEAITRQDGETKNDCERNAAKRLLPARRNRFSKTETNRVGRQSRRQCTPSPDAPGTTNELHNSGQRDRSPLFKDGGRNTNEWRPGEITRNS